MSYSFKKKWNLFTTVLVILLLALGFLMAGVKFIGYEPYTVLSGSMEPTYKTGSVIYVKDVDCKSLRIGEAITFLLDENTVATHRIVDIVKKGTNGEELYFQTKGDANDDVDANLVYYKNVIGKPVFSIPVLGYLANYLQSTQGLYLAITVVALLLFLIFVPEIMSVVETKPETKPAKEIKL